MILDGKAWMITASGVSRVERENEMRKALKPGAGAIDLVAEQPREMSMLDDNGIAHINICGVIGHRMDWFDKFCGNTDVCDVRRELDRAQEEGANGIFLRIDSPGGGIVGTAELAGTIAAITVPVVAFSDACCASAAYWLACGAGQIWTTETCEIGSVGIYLPWLDKSVAYQNLGLSFEPFTNTEGIYKSAGHGPSLTSEQREQMQVHIDRIYAMFNGFVSDRRPNLMEEAKQGQAFVGADAPMYGLSDFTGTIEQAYSALCLEAGVFPMDIDLDQLMPFSFEGGIILGEEIKKGKLAS